MYLNNNNLKNDFIIIYNYNLCLIMIEENNNKIIKQRGFQIGLSINVFLIRLVGKI